MTNSKPCSISETLYITIYIYKIHFQISNLFFSSSLTSIPTVSKCRSDSSHHPGADSYSIGALISCRLGALEVDVWVNIVDVYGSRNEEKYPTISTVCIQSSKPILLGIPDS